MQYLTIADKNKRQRSFFKVLLIVVWVQVLLYLFVAKQEPLLQNVEYTGLVELAVNETIERQLTDFVVPKQESPKEAVCEWTSHDVNRHHLAHEMEYLYRCWSYFNTMRHQFPGIPLKLFIDPSEYALSWHNFMSYVTSKPWRKWRQPFNQMTFVHGILQVFETVNIQITTDVTDKQHGFVRRSDSASFDAGDAYRMRSYRDARDLSRDTATALNLTQSSGCPLRTLPRVAILNRRPSTWRALVKADSIARHLELALRDRIHDNTVPVVYFDRASFREQVQFFFDTDIVVSPHGQQLTGMVFLPDCSAVLEIFPQYFYYQRFFGSLALASGVKQYTLYLGSNHTEGLDFSNKTARRNNKRQQIYPSATQVLGVVQEMIDGWQDCCHHNGDS